MSVLWQLGGIAVVILIGGVALLWWWVPKWQMRSMTVLEDPKARADIEDNFRKTVGQALGTIFQVLGGIVVLIGAWLAYHGTQLTLIASDAQSRRSLEASAEQSRRSLEASDKQSQLNLEASRALLISQQVAKSFEQLGNDKMIVRLGGIYALEGVMETSDQYYTPALEALCAFVRNTTTTTDVNAYAPAADIQAALTVIGRRRQHHWRDVNLKDARIPGADLGQFTNLVGAVLDGVDLTGAQLPGVDLSDAELVGAKLHDANLMGTWLTNTDLSGADLSGTELVGAKLVRTKVFAANLSNTNFISPARPQPGITPFRTEPLYDAKLTGVSLGSAADLAGIHISQAQLDNLCGDAALLARLPAGLTLNSCQSEDLPAVTGIAIPSRASAGASPAGF